MAYRDLRDWLEKVDAFGELKHMSGVDWNEEIGLLRFLTRLKNFDAPATLFDEIKDYPKGFRVLVGLLSSKRRLALTVGAPDVKTDMELVSAVRSKMKTLKAIPPRVVKTGPVMENVQKGDQIDLFTFPTPKWHRHDAARYIGTMDAIITRDPDEGWINVGTYRTMIRDKRSLLSFIDVGRHATIQREKYFARGQNMPVVYCFGADPVFPLVGAMGLPYGASEMDYAGGLKGAPIDVIMGEMTGLPIPATAEIAVEAEFLRDEAAIEGPFAEFTGYYGSTPRPEPVVRVKSVMFRNNPIITGLPANGRVPRARPNNRLDFEAVMRSALIWNHLEATGIPDVKGVWCHAAGGGLALTIIAIKQRYAGHAKQAAMAAAGHHAGAHMSKYIIVVDEDIDPTYDFEVLWSLSTRTDPEKSIDFVRRVRGSMLNIANAVEDRPLTSTAIIEACMPFERLKDLGLRAQFDPEFRKTLEKKYGASIYE